MIKRLYIDNFKSLVHFELPLQKWTLLLGSNGTGKTAILDVVFALRQFLSGGGHLPDKVKPPENVVFETSTTSRW